MTTKTEQQNLQPVPESGAGETAVSPAAPGRKRTPFKKLELIRNWKYYLMAAPVIVLFFLFAYLPLPGIILAFKNYTITGGIFGSPWAGLENFKVFFGGADLWRVTRNILLLNSGNLILSTVMNVGGAILLNELFSTKAKKIYQNILFLPTFFSALLVAKFFNMMLSNDIGLINDVLKRIGLDPVMWYNNSAYWIPIVMFAMCWKGLGYGIVLYLAAISGFDGELYEAAYIDGAGKWKQVTKITLPLLKPIVILQILLAIGRIFNGDFMFVYAFVGDNYVLKETLDIVETYIFRTLLGAGGVGGTMDYGLTAAIGLYQSVLGAVVVFTSNFIVRRCNKDYALF